MTAAITQKRVPKTAKSVWLRIFLARLTFCAPSSPTSSRPAVSITVMGPMGRSSMLFCTGSAVEPGAGEIRETSCPVRALTKEDLPTLRRPKKAMAKRLERGVVCICFPFGRNYGCRLIIARFRARFSFFSSSPAGSRPRRPAFPGTPLGKAGRAFFENDLCYRNGYVLRSER